MMGLGKQPPCKRLREDAGGVQRQLVDVNAVAAAASGAAAGGGDAVGPSQGLDVSWIGAACRGGSGGVGMEQGARRRSCPSSVRAAVALSKSVLDDSEEDVPPLAIPAGQSSVQPVGGAAERPSVWSVPTSAAVPERHGGHRRRTTRGRAQDTSRGRHRPVIKLGPWPDAAGVHLQGPAMHQSSGAAAAPRVAGPEDSGAVIAPTETGASLAGMFAPSACAAVTGLHAGTTSVVDATVAHVTPVDCCKTKETVDAMSAVLRDAMAGEEGARDIGWQGGGMESGRAPGMALVDDHVAAAPPHAVHGAATSGGGALYGSEAGDTDRSAVQVSSSETGSDDDDISYVPSAAGSLPASPVLSDAEGDGDDDVVTVCDTSPAKSVGDEVAELHRLGDLLERPELYARWVVAKHLHQACVPCSIL